MKIKFNIVALWGAVLCGLVSCKDHDNPGRQYAPNMYESEGYEPLTQSSVNSINPHGMNMRYPVKGTIARQYFSKDSHGDSTKISRIVSYHYDKFSLEQAAKEPNPIPYSDAVLEEGKNLYERNCMHCHGASGTGDGKVAAKYKGVPNYSSDALKEASMGHIVHVITHGKGRMWPHASQVTPAERWKIAFYVNKLQKGE